MLWRPVMTSAAGNTCLLPKRPGWHLPAGTTICLATLGRAVSLRDGTSTPALDLRALGSSRAGGVIVCQAQAAVVQAASIWGSFVMAGLLVSAKH